ncbi:hypothetical protein FH063_001850 [Azospirillum argentinense]|uniref:DUF2325 domain-containing protein n=3 Tax=Azospirillum TaxID=191 RepID=A0A5B0KYK1_9PROT|nr:hypothetical protein FH063_001850 [Azospirillum argentinense]
MCERCRKTVPSCVLGQAKRRKLWTIPTEYHCSIVGTCLSSEDVAWLCRRLKLVPTADARPYDIHRYFVEKAAEDGPEARLMHKRLDETFAVAVKRFARETTEEGWMALWTAAVASGDVAAAYWGVLSHGAMPDAVRVRAFADVHMLSHIMGGENRRQLRENRDLSRRCEELTARLAKQERAATERVAEKDARIRELEAQLATQRAAPAVPETPNVPKAPSVRAPGQARLLRTMDALHRRVASERMRARHAEAEVERLRRLLDPPAAQLRRTAAAETNAPTDLGGRAILYVGGRTKSLPHLRAAVETRNGCLLHHDGGFEQTTRCLEGLVERADVVVCPVDCVSHDACLRVKGLCRRMGKPFVPMRSAGATSFARILHSFGQDGAGEESAHH